jgi:hypothetical protein
VRHTPHPCLISMEFNSDLTAASFNGLHHGVVVTSVIHHYSYNLRKFRSFNARINIMTLITNLILDVI